MTETFAEGALLLEPGRVARLTLNAPQRRNAMSRAMWAAMPAIARRVEEDHAIRVLIVAGAGEAAFSAGADIAEFAEVYADAASASAYNALVRAGQAALAQLGRPVIAAIRGACFGGGVGIALHCDLRIAADDARFAVTPARLGLAYGPQDTAALVAAVGPARAREMLLTGRVVAAPEACAIGLVNEIAAPGALDERVGALADELASLAPGALAAIKTIVSGVAGLSDDSEARLRDAFEARFVSDEFREGATAFLERRKPRF